MQRDFNMNWKVAAMHAPSKPIPAMMSINCSDPDSCPSASLMLYLPTVIFLSRRLSLESCHACFQGLYFGNELF